MLSLIHPYTKQVVFVVSLYTFTFQTNHLYVFVKEEERWIKFNVYFTSKQYRQQRNTVLPFWCVVYVRQAIKTAVRDLVLHGIVSQSKRPSIINGVRFYDWCSNINCRLSRSKKASNIKFYLNFNRFPLIDLMRFYISVYLLHCT